VTSLNSTALERWKNYVRGDFWDLQMIEFPQRFAEDVAQALELLGLGSYVRCCHDYDGYLLDVALTIPLGHSSTHTVAILCHTAMSVHHGTQQPLGNSIMRHRYLSKKGVKAVNLWWDAWKTLPTIEERATFLSERLHSVGINEATLELLLHKQPRPHPSPEQPSSQQHQHPKATHEDVPRHTETERSRGQSPSAVTHDAQPALGQPPPIEGFFPQLVTVRYANEADNANTAPTGGDTQAAGSTVMVAGGRRRGGRRAGRRPSEESQAFHLFMPDHTTAATADVTPTPTPPTEGLYPETPLDEARVTMAEQLPPIWTRKESRNIEERRHREGESDSTQEDDDASTWDEDGEETDGEASASVGGRAVRLTMRQRSRIKEYRIRQTRNRRRRELEKIVSETEGDPSQWLPAEQEQETGAFQLESDAR